MFDRIGPEVWVNCVISATRGARDECETEARSRAKRWRSNLCLARPVRQAGSTRNTWSPHAVTRARSRKSVATEYYRPNIEDCGGCAFCPKERRIFKHSRALCDLRRAGDGPMQSWHDCESEFGSTSESGLQRGRSAQPAIGASISADPASSACAPTATAATNGTEPSTGRHGASAPGRQPTAATAEAQPAARTEPERWP